MALVSASRRQGSTFPSPESQGGYPPRGSRPCPALPATLPGFPGSQAEETLVLSLRSAVQRHLPPDTAGWDSARILTSLSSGLTHESTSHPLEGKTSLQYKIIIHQSDKGSPANEDLMCNPPGQRLLHLKHGGLGKGNSSRRKVGALTSQQQPAPRPVLRPALPEH